MLRQCAHGLLRLCGWRLQGQAPSSDRCVVVAAPHTSNWDFPWLILMAAALGVRIRWLGKHTLFKGPAGWVMRALGGIPVVRSSRNDMVEQIAQRFAEAAELGQSLVLVIPPEGTRRRTEGWKSGFFHMARLAGVPVSLSVLDYGQRSGGFGPEIPPGTDVSASMALIREFYSADQAKYPEQFGPIRLPDEDIRTAADDAA